MREQINTIRSELTSLHGIVGDLSEALTALSNLESHLAQYEAGDMASAAAQGFRDGVASVQQGQEPVAWLVCSVNSDGSLNLEHATAWEEAAHEHINDAITEHGIEEAASWVVRPAYVAAPVAQHPQTEPDDETLKERDDAEDFIDMLLDEVLGTDRPEWTSAYGRDDALRDVQERMTALHKPTVDKAWDRFEKAQQPQVRPNDIARACPFCNAEWVEQPQAEADIHEAQGQIEFLDEKNNALSAAIRKVMARLADLLDEDQFKEIEEIVSFAGVQPQAEAVPAGYRLVMLPDAAPGDEPDWDECIRQSEAATGLKVERHTISIVIREVRRWLAHRQADKAAPQQAEAVQGWKLVPVEPTGEMIHQGWDFAGSMQNASATYSAMLAAAPQPKQAEAVPPGYVLVPVEPTDEMIQGFWGDITHGELEREAAKEAWRKAIDAAIAQQKGGV